MNGSWDLAQNWDASAHQNTIPNPSTTSPPSDTSHPTGLPPMFTEISPESWRSIIGYAILFIFSALGNVLVLFSILKNIKAKHRVSPMHRLLLHLCIADLIVVFTVIPIEIGWRIYIGWRAGNIACKFLQFIRAFGLYLSSIMLVCISIDRYNAICHPLKNIGSSRVKKMLIFSWIFAAFCSIPQAIIFHTETHPEFQEFTQCMSSALGESAEIWNTCFSLLVMYFLPLATIVFTYSRIIHKIFKESTKANRASASGAEDAIPSSTPKSPKRKSFHLSVPTNNTHFEESSADCNYSSETNANGKDTPMESQSLSLRRSGPSNSNLQKARIRTIKLTFCIIFVFLITWTPYVVINIWVLLDYKMASNLDPSILDALFIMAVANSLANPIVYFAFYIRKSPPSTTQNASTRRLGASYANQSIRASSHYS